MAKQKTKPEDDSVEATPVVKPPAVAPVETKPEETPLPPPPVALGAPGSVVKPNDSDELEAVVKNASSYKGRTVVVLKESKDIPAVQKLIQDCKSDHHIGVKVNAKLQVRALWRCQ